MNCPTKNINNKVNPRTARPATPRPITVPPPKETCKCFRQTCLSCFCGSCICIGCNTHSDISCQSRKESSKTKAGTIIQLVVSTATEIPKRATEAMMTKINNRRYSALRKASAPSFMAFDISCILSLPGACFFTQLARINIYTKPTTAKI